MAEEKKEKVSIGFRIDTDIVNTIDKICKKETDKTGYDIDRSDIMRKALLEFIERYEKKAS